MHTISIRFGRNVGGDPLSEEEWNGLAYAIEEEVERFGGDIIGQQWGTGWWRENGVRFAEDTRTIDADLPTNGAAALLRTRLESIASTYRQEAIGLIVLDESTLIRRK